MMSTAPAPSPVHAEMAPAFSLIFLFYWLGVLCHLFPAVSFLITKDWKKVFYDCFGPEVLIADSWITLIILWFHIFGPRKAGAIESIIHHTLGLALNFMSICMFAMYHSLCGGAKRARRWYCTLFGSFALAVLLTFMWMEMSIRIEEGHIGKAYLGYASTIFAELFQVFWPAATRVYHENFTNDEKQVLWLKISATIASIVVSSSDLSHMIEENYWASELEKQIMVLTMINIVGATLQLVVRFIGPERFAKPVKKFTNHCHEWWTARCADCKEMFSGWNV